MKTTTMCHCGRSLHYTDASLEAILTGLCEKLGDFINISADGRTWRVQRHYVALHGVVGVELADLGFQEVTT